jgi:hypothetical protein
MTSTAHSSLCPSLINAFPPPPPTTSATGHWIRVRDPKGHKFARTVMRDGEIQFYVPFEMPPGGLKSLRLPPGIDIIDNGPFKKTQTPSYASGSRTLPSRFHERSRAPRPEPFSRVSPSNPPNGSWYTKPTTQTQRPSPTPAPIPSTTTLPKKPTKELPTRKSKPLANLSKPSKPRASKVSRKSNRIPVRYRGEEEVAPQRISFARTDMTTASVYSQDSWVEPTREPVPAIPTTFKKRLSASRQYNTAPIRRKRRSSRGEKRRSFQAPHLSEESDSTADEHGRAYAKLEGKPYTPSKNTQQTDPSVSRSITLIDYPLTLYYSQRSSINIQRIPDIPTTSPSPLSVESLVS